MPSDRLFPTLAIAALLAPALAGCVAETAKVPSGVTDVRVTQDPEGARLTWDEEPRGVAVSYVVYRNGQKLADVDAPRRTYLDNSVEPGVVYRYAVSTVNAQGKEGKRSEEADFRLVRSLALLQETPLARGYANLTVLEASAGLEWADLSVTLDGDALVRSEAEYNARRAAWTHTTPRDPLVDLGEHLKLHAPGDVVRNASIEVRLSDGTLLFREFLKGNPAINLTLRQERNVTEGFVTLTVVGVAWLDNGRNVTTSYPDLRPRWSAIEVSVNGTHVPYFEDSRPGSWTRDLPFDGIIRVGNRMTIRSEHVGATAVVVVKDAEAWEESFRAVLR